MSQDVMLEIEIARHDERIRDIEDWRAKQNGTLAEIRKELKEIRALYDARPSWSVTIIISFLATVASGSIMFIVSSL
jgi:hypothetical protein